MTDLIHLATLLQTYYLSHSHLLPTLNTLLIGISAIVFSYYAGKLFSEGWDVPVMQWQAPEAAKPDWIGKMIEKPNILAWKRDSSLIPAKDEMDKKPDEEVKYLTCYDPATGYHIETLPLPTQAQMCETIVLAHTAYKTHRKTTFAQRRRLLRCFKSWLLKDLQTVVRVGARDTGKTEVDAFLGEILTTFSKIDYMLKHGEKALRPERRVGNLLLAHKVSKLHYEPLGVVCAIVSWNYPIHNALSPIIAALFTGNSIIVKSSEQVYWSSRWIVGAIRKALEMCEMDRDAVQLLCCMPEDAKVITTHPLITHITFIGSENVGRIVARSATENLIPTCIELGGKDCALLLPSADVKFFASTFMRAAFQANGQNCIGIERFIVHRSIYDQFISLLTPRVKSLRCGSSLSSSPGTRERPIVDCGAMISDQRFDELEAVIGKAVHQGAKLVCGGKRMRHETWKEGHYFEPTMLVDVTHDMDVARQELFAPVLTVMPYDTVEEGIRIANDTRYGLGSAVFGREKSECRKVAEQLECGMVAINDFGVFYLNQSMPFGGAKASGYSRFGGPEGLRSLCNLKVISEDIFFSTIKTSIPPVLDYPLKNASKAWIFASGLTWLAFADSWVGSGKGLTEVIRGAL